MIKNIVFIDSRVAGYESIIGGLGADTEWILLNADQDGILQMERALKDYSALDAIHVISHGSVGALYLGNTILSSYNLQGYSGALSNIGASLTDSGDILLYGCSLGSGDAGQVFIESLAMATKADVAASDDLTGSASLDGDWALEQATGSVETAGLFAEEYSGLLVGNTAPIFGIGDGKLTTAIGSANDTGFSVILQADGKILVAGTAYNGSYSDFALVRYNTDGSLDTSFSGDGKLTTAIGSDNDYGYSVTLQTDGKILVAGTAIISGIHDFALVRYNIDGSLDNSFSGDGKLTTDFGASYDLGRSVTLQADGKVLVAGTAVNGSNDDFALVRYNTDGSLDTSFDGDGKLTTAIGSANDQGFSVILQADGKILVAGTTYSRDNNDFALVRYNNDGSLDTSFDGDGKLTTDIGSSHDHANDVTLQADGKILVAGTAYSGSYTDFALVRYNVDGSLDTSFDGDGKLTTAIGSANDRANGITLQADGKILVAGTTYSGDSSDFALVRYNIDGSLDNSFSGDGKLTTTIGWGVNQANDVTLQADGKILVVGTAFNGNNGNDNAFALARYNIDGSLDTSFNPHGKIDNSPTTMEQIAVLLDGTVLVHDAELDASGNYAGASVSLSRHGGANGDDQFYASGNLSAFTQGGLLVLSSTIIGTVTQSSAGALVLTFNSNATQAQVNEALSSIKYLNASDTPPVSVQIDWTFSDGNTGAQGVGGALSTVGSTLVTITPVNDAPTGTNATLGMAINGIHTFSLADFGFVDAEDGATLTAVRIDTVPLAGRGSLLYDGTVMPAGLTLTAADISGGHLTYRPSTDAAGLSYASFTFSVKDSGGLFDASPNRLTFDVIAPNSAPTATNLSAAEIYTEDTPLDLTNIVITDVDSASVTATLILSNSAAGALSTATSGTVTSTFNVGVWSVSGAIADVNTLLAGVTFTPTLNFNGNFTITTTVGDGVAPAVTGSKSFMGTAVDDEATGTLGVSGTAEEGGSLIALLTGATDADASIISTAYQWQISDNGSTGWSNLSTGATLNLASDQSQVGKSVRVLATTTDVQGGTTEFTGSAQVVANINDAPTGGVTITGAATQSQTLTATNNLADVDGLGIISYQWFADGIAISGATGTTLLLAQAQVGKAITVTASYTDGFGTPESKVSSGTSPIASSDTQAPFVSSFSPVDAATGIAIAGDIMLTFNETIVLGAGSISLKTAAGSTVATYDASGSANLSISGNVLTINPTLDLDSGTEYLLEITAGTIKDLAGNPYAGTTSYNFTTASGIKTITGTTGNDLLQGTSDTDMIAGLGGIDTVQFSGAFGSFNLTKTAPAAWTVVGEGSDQLLDVERLQFSDMKIALDLAPSEHAGQALEFIGVMAPSLVHSPSIVGVVLGLIDGGLSMQGVFQLAIDIGLVNDIAGANSNAAVAQMAFRNVIGAEADAGMTDLLVSFMDGRNANFSHADFLTVIAGMEINQVHIDLIGLQQTGIEFI